MVRAVSGLVQASVRSPRVHGLTPTLLAVIITGADVFRDAGIAFDETAAGFLREAAPDSIAAICLAIRDEFGLIPHVYFDWTEGSPPVAPVNYSCVVTGLLCPARVVEGATRQRFAVPDRRIPSCSVAVPSPPRRP
jgi:hypothetical protein